MSSEASKSPIQNPEHAPHDGPRDLPTAGGMENFLTAHQLAEKLQVSADWIYDQASSGGMPSYRIGTIRRFRSSEIEDWLQRHRDPRSLGGVPALRTS